MNSKIINYLNLFLTLALISAPIWINKAQASEPETYASVKIIPQQTAVTSNSQITIATEITLEPDWHVYWKNPGDSGLPVAIEWTAPKDFNFSDIKWATPDKISYDILVNYGYYDKVILLQTLDIPQISPNEPITITANISMLVCKEICIPENAEITIGLNNPNTPNIDNSAYITQAKTKLPQNIDGNFTYTEQNNMLNISLDFENKSALKLNDATTNNIDFFPSGLGIINHVTQPKVTIKDNNITIIHERGSELLTDLQGLLIIKSSTHGNNKGFYITAKQSSSLITATNKTKPQTSKITWVTALYLALFGGIILNLMPCVFPILSMKALSLVKMGDKEHKVARRHGIAYTLGVVLSFIAIGGILLILKEAGTMVGWGFQLQNPVVVAILAYLFFTIGLNLIGFFEFSFGLGGNIGNKLTQGNSLSSSFFTGALTTIVATPCTAPFMGAAMGFALTQPAIVSISVFAMLGFGLALPYLILSYVPQLRKALPKPGKWMNTFKQFLAFPMFASAIWLIWVLSQQSGSYGVLLILLGMLAIAFCVWISHLKSKDIGKKHLTSVLLFLFLLLPFFSLFYIKTTAGNIDSENHILEIGVEFSQNGLDKLLKGDDPIFVEMTAAWCITCKANHAIAINIDSTKKLIKDNNIQYLIGDWTNKDDEITKYLASFNRNGVPLYIYYGKRDPQTKKRPEPVILPQILTPSTLQKALSQ